MIFFIISISFCFVLVYFLLNLIENFNAKSVSNRTAIPEQIAQ